MKIFKIITLISILLFINCNGQNNINENKKSQNNTSKENTLNINEKSLIILLYPSENEIDSLKKVWGEDKFYLVADGENGYMSTIFNLLGSKNEKYITSTSKNIFFKNSNKYFDKSLLKNSWGVITYKNNKILCSNTIEFIKNYNKQADSNTDDCVLNNISKKFNFTIIKNNYNGLSNNQIKIIIQNKKTLKKQNITYKFNSILSSDIPCKPITYFKNSNQIKQNSEDFNSFIIADFNFDGLEDFAYLWDSGGNGGPLFKYFFQNKDESFIEDKSFPLQESYFPNDISIKNKTLTTARPIGCCKIAKTVFQFQGSEWKVISKEQKDLVK